MNAAVVPVCAAAFVLSMTLSGVLRRFALRRALIDVPNARSLHKVPVPRLGGVAIVLAAVGTLGVVATISGCVPGLPWITIATIVAALGLVDDLRSLSAALRLPLQAALGYGFVRAAHVSEHVALGGGILLDLPQPVVTGVAVVYVVGALNIYNFMDGMDGLAGVQAVGAGLAIALASACGGHGDLALAAFVLAACAAGFLAHNYPPATIFMGDAGSTFFGFSLVALGLLGTAGRDPLPLAVAPLALAPFLLDGTFTLFRRLSRRERIWEAHRSHLYQRAVATGLDHRAVLLPYAAWVAASAACAVAAVQATGPVFLVLVAVPVAGLLGMWGWVARRERSAQ